MFDIEFKNLCSRKKNGKPEKLQQKNLAYFKMSLFSEKKKISYIKKGFFGVRKNEILYRSKKNSLHIGLIEL